MYTSLVILCHIFQLIAIAEQGTSRGGADIRRIVQRLSLWGISMLFVVGGNGVTPAQVQQKLSSTCWVPMTRAYPSLVSARPVQLKQCDDLWKLRVSRGVLSRRLLCQLPRNGRRVVRRCRWQCSRQRHPAGVREAERAVQRGRHPQVGAQVTCQHRYIFRNLGSSNLIQAPPHAPL